MKIIYKENGEVDIEKSIAKELERLEEKDKKLDGAYRNPINEMKKAIEELEKSDIPLISDEIYKLLDKLGEGSRGKIYYKTHKLYDGEQKTESKPFKDLFEIEKYSIERFKENGIEYYNSLEEEDRKYKILFLKDDINRVILSLTGAKSKGYISKIEDIEGNIIYSNEIEPDARPIEIYEKYVKKFGQYAGTGYLTGMIKEYEYPLHMCEYAINESKSMIGEVTKLIEDGSKCVYPQRKEELIKYLLNNATEPDLGEDEFDIQSTYKIAVEALQMIDQNASVSDVCQFIDNAKEKRRLINDFDIYSFLAKFGKETGIQVFEEKVIKPAEKRDGNVGYSDYYVCKVEKAKELAEKYRQENQNFEMELEGLV